MNPANEIILIVDKENNETGTATRSEMRAKGLPHRASYILVFNSTGELFVQKRTETKDIYPGYYDVAAGGVVLAGETYDQSALRELAEELGIENTTLQPHFTFCHKDTSNIVWGKVYTCVHDGPMILQEEEIQSGEFMPVDKVLQMSELQPLTPDGQHVLNRLFAKCDICGNHIIASELISDKGQWLCPECLSEINSCGCNE